MSDPVAKSVEFSSFPLGQGAVVVLEANEADVETMPDAAERKRRGQEDEEREELGEHHGLENFADLWQNE
jgi:hypothetical protein